MAIGHVTVNASAAHRPTVDSHHSRIGRAFIEKPASRDVETARTTSPPFAKLFGPFTLTLGGNQRLFLSVIPSRIKQRCTAIMLPEVRQ